MKRNVLLATVLVVAVTCFFAMPVVAQEPVCSTCKTPDGEIPIPTGAQMSCGTFDFDGSSGSDRGSYGYCNNSPSWKAIVSVCNCPNPTRDFNVGDVIGVRVSILTRGVYWAENATPLNFGMYPSERSACDDLKSDRNAQMNVNDDLDGDGVAEPPLPRVFRDISYYRTRTCEPGTEANPYSGSTCALNASQKAVAFMSGTGGGYRITEDDDLRNLSRWWVELPAMRIVPNEVTEGEPVQVQIEMLSEGTGGICATCNSVCECVITVGTLGCGRNDCITFPYVLIDSGNWATGIAVTNLDNDRTPAEMSAVFTMVDSTGKAFTSEKNDFTQVVNAWMVDDMIANWNWTPAGTPASGPAYLGVKSNFNIDGYEFNTDGTFGAGTQPRWWCPNWMLED